LAVLLVCAVLVFLAGAAVAAGLGVCASALATPSRPMIATFNMLEILSSSGT
jgi:hypothetical protein